MQLRGFGFRNSDAGLHGLFLSLRTLIAAAIWLRWKDRIANVRSPHDRAQVLLRRILMRRNELGIF